MILKIILFALCANLLYTNANLMLTATENQSAAMTILMIIFALTYSLISTLSLFKLQSALTAVCFALLDGFAVYTHLSVHSANFKTIVGVYFGVYTAYTLIVAYIIKRHEEQAQKKPTTIDGKDVEYWHRCFLYQKQRADSKEQVIIEKHEEQKPIETTEPKPIATDQPKQLSQFSEDETKMLLSIKRAFARMKDNDKRRERIEDLPENVKKEIKKIYEL